MATLTKLRLPSIIDQHNVLKRSAGLPLERRPPSAIGSPQFKKVRELVGFQTSPSRVLKGERNDPGPQPYAPGGSRCDGGAL